MLWAGRQEEHFAELIVFYEAGELWNPQAMDEGGTQTPFPQGAPELGCSQAGMGEMWDQSTFQTFGAPQISGFGAFRCFCPIPAQELRFIPKQGCRGRGMLGFWKISHPKEMKVGNVERGSSCPGVGIFLGPTPTGREKNVNLGLVECQESWGWERC